MIAETPTISLSSIERIQLDQIESAKGAWKEGRSKDALILLELVKGKPASNRLKAACHVAEAAFYAELGDFERSREALDVAAPVIDSAPVSVRAAFYHQRARIRKRSGTIDAALTDYAGAEVLWGEIGANHDQGSAILNVSECYLSLGDLEAAQREVLKAFELFQKSNSFYLPHAHDTQAKIHLAEGRLEAAAESIDKALAAVTREDWRAEFLATQERIEIRLLAALQVNHLSDLDRIRLDMVRRALQQSSGSPAAAAELLDVTRHAVEWIVDHHPQELERYRMPRRIRRKSIIKQK